MKRTHLLRHAYFAAAALMLASPGTALAEQPTAKEVVFVLGNNLFSTPAFAAVENGYWAKRGLNVRLKLVASGREITQALNAGEAQLGGANMGTTTASARASGNMIKGVIPYYNDAAYIAVAGGRGIVGRKDRGVTADAKSLVGKKIGSLAGSTQEVYLLEYLARNGVDPKQVQIVNVPVPDMPISLMQGVVDATVPWEPYLQQSLRELGDNGLVVSRGAPGLVADVIGVLANEKYIADNKDLLETFALGLAEGTQFVRQNAAEAAKIATYHLDGLNVADATEGIKHMAWDPRISICTDEGLLKTGNDMISQGLIKGAAFKSANEFAERSVLDKVMERNPELFADLPPLPANLSDCKGALN
ncbi:MULTISPECIES: ABC transporter substrate-binding protein [unclassified Chelatococcus]|uniref:ABC transporter substrate-binding protein n=1 Tax=unclassified Chelatococcus TaxID=2638111 RepID=UPI001BCFFCF2|nr:MULTISPECIES: ABC transporter substrate-binding protein [unclassified Chelatococcus]MBS7700656.1 ABC transporter substrate-binding protein [Chelatococcus sp. YT9]MBX3559087.1 ABC transporter substrate-binding protein [Chelatococcus sp.]